MAMAGAIVAPSTATVLFRDESTCSTSCRSSRASVAPESRLGFSPLSAICRGQLGGQLSARARVICLPCSESRLLCCRSGLSFSTSWHGRSHLGEMVGLLLEGRLGSGSSGRGIAGKVHASLLGVGAPEALVIAVVALVVFGPKGLAEIARTLGKSLKAFQPTIQELQQVSREFRSTLEQEIGLDELRKPMDVPPTYQKPPPQQQPPNGAPDAKAYTATDYMRVTPEEAKALVPEDLRREAEAAAWGSSSPPKTTTKNDTTAVVSEEEKPTNES